MLPTNLQLGRERGEDRFYIPVKARKNQNQKQLQKQAAAKSDEKESVSPKSEALRKASEQSVVSVSNLDRFLKSTTPSVPAQYLSKTTMRGWSTCDIEFQPYFTLGDLWESFKEWSVYGAGVPLVLDGNDCVVQYYVPYLSGIQLYGESTESTAKSRDNLKPQKHGHLGVIINQKKVDLPRISLPLSPSIALYVSMPSLPFSHLCPSLPLTHSLALSASLASLSGSLCLAASIIASVARRQAAEGSDCDYYRDSSSDGSSDYEVEKGIKFSGMLQGRYHLTNDVSSRIGSLSLSDENSMMQEGFSSDDSETGSSRGLLLFEYLEQDTPYGREPLADKISDLSCRYPGLKTLRSCDLLPISWISVAWYPIYRIPTGPTLKDLDACFLTYHSLSTPVKGSGGGHAPVMVYPSEIDDVPKLSMPIFGMASYKFKGSMWTQNGVSEHQPANSLMQAAENWLRLLHVNHPDFQFFASHGMYHR